MSLYYINAGNHKAGPFSAEQLLAQDVSRTTLVWSDGYTDWLPAGDIPELSELFRTVLPSVKSFGSDKYVNPEERRKEKSQTLAAIFWSVVLVIILAALLVLFFNSRRQAEPEYDDQRRNTVSYVAIHCAGDILEASSPISA